MTEAAVHGEGIARFCDFGFGRYIPNWIGSMLCTPMCV